MEPQAESSKPVEIRVENLHKSFSANRVLCGLDLSINRGEMVAIVGGSGCGKTVLLKIIIGEMTFDQGRILIADHEAPDSPLVDISTLDEDGMDRLRIHWGIVFQKNALLTGTVEENIATPLELVKGLEENEIKQRVWSTVEAVGLKPQEVLQLKRDELSGGMAKRVAIARALAVQPLVVFFDEPTTGLDPEHSSRIQDLILDTHERVENKTRRTTIIITHDKDLLHRLEPRIVMLHEGKVFFDGSYSLFKASTSPVIRPYFELMPVLHRRQTRE